MHWQLFLDDERYPAKGGFKIARTYQDAVNLIEEYGPPFYISFDHDLGEGKNGYDFAKWFADYVIETGAVLPEEFGYYVHSMNPIGAKNIAAFMENFIDHYNKG